MAEEMQTKWINVEQLMLMLPLKRSRIYYLVHVGAIPCYHVGKTLLFDQAEIDAWVRKGGSNGNGNRVPHKAAF